MSGVWGKRIELSIFGESHGPAIGVTLHGLPAGFMVDMEHISRQMRRRRPGHNEWSTPRKEADDVEIISGLFQGRTTGAPLTAIIRNQDKKSKDYEALKDVMRPSHADYVAYVKYHKAHDYRGGGHFSGRLTAPLVFAGALAAQLLSTKSMETKAVITSIGGQHADLIDVMTLKKEDLQALQERDCPTLVESQWKKLQGMIEEARIQLDSVGGTIQCVTMGVPPGVGDPFFHSLESHLSGLLFSIPAVKGVSFGSGFALADMKGSEANDPLCYEQGQVVSQTNHNGGILGGISTGMPLDIHLVMKPTPSIGQEQDTVDVKKSENAKLTIQGRHDPCIVPRALPVVEAAVSLALLDMMMWSQVWN